MVICSHSKVEKLVKKICWKTADKRILYGWHTCCSATTNENHIFPRKRVLYSCEVHHKGPYRTKAVTTPCCVISWQIISRKDRHSGRLWCHCEIEISRMWQAVSPVDSKGPLWMFALSIDGFVSVRGPGNRAESCLRATGGPDLVQ